MPLASQRYSRKSRAHHKIDLPPPESNMYSYKSSLDPCLHKALNIEYENIIKSFYWQYWPGLACCSLNKTMGPSSTISRGPRCVCVCVCVMINHIWSAFFLGSAAQHQKHPPEYGDDAQNGPKVYAFISMSNLHALALSYGDTISYNFAESKYH